MVLSNVHPCTIVCKHKLNLWSNVHSCTIMCKQTWFWGRTHFSGGPIHGRTYPRRTYLQLFYFGEPILWWTYPQADLSAANLFAIVLFILIENPFLWWTYPRADPSACGPIRGEPIRNYLISFCWRTYLHAFWCHIFNNWIGKLLWELLCRWLEKKTSGGAVYLSLLDIMSLSLFFL